MCTWLMTRASDETMQNARKNERETIEWANNGAQFFLSSQKFLQTIYYNTSRLRSVSFYAVSVNCRVARIRRY